MNDTRTPHQCPTCNGHRTVQKPPWVAGDQDSWQDHGTGSHECPTCRGEGVVW